MTRLAIGVGLLAISVAGIALLAGIGGTGGTATGVLLALLAIVGIVGALWKLLATPGAGESSVVQPPWTDDGALFDRPPERTGDDEVLSGESFAALLSNAGSAARENGTVEAGFESIRPVLRRALGDALAHRLGDRDAVEAAIESGTWTDDRAAAAVLAPGIEFPPWSLRQRLEAWLFPERVVRRQLQRTVQAIAEAADDAIPNVPGQNAPRNVPVLQPRLAALQRGVDGRIQRAVDPLATTRGPRPPGSEEPSVDIDDEVSDSTGDGRSPGAADADVGDSRQSTADDDADQSEASTMGVDDARDTGRTVDDGGLFVERTDQEGTER